MKKLLIILGSTFLVILVLAVAGISFAVNRGVALDKESKAYVDSVLPVIVSGWDKQELLRRASPEFQQVVKEGEVDKLYIMFRRLGNLHEYQGSEGQSDLSVTSQKGKVISATYTARANFDAAPAVIKVSLIKHGDEWQILGFHIDSDVFLQNP